MRDLLAMAGAGATSRRRGRVPATAAVAIDARPLNSSHVARPETLLALERQRRADSHLDHGYPVRLIAPEPAGRAADEVGRTAGGPVSEPMSEVADRPRQGGDGRCRCGRAS